MYLKMNERVKLNLRGTLFITRQSTLQNIPFTRLSNLSKETSSEYDPECDEYYFDKDPTYFHWILEVYSSGELHVPSWVCPTRATKEILFWKIPYKVQPCCWKSLHENDNETFKFLLTEDKKTSYSNKIVTEKNFETAQEEMKILKKTFMSSIRDAYDKPFESLCGKLLFWTILILTTMSFMTYALNTQADVRVSRSAEELKALLESISGPPDSHSEPRGENDGATYQNITMVPSVDLRSNTTDAANVDVESVTCNEQRIGNDVEREGRMKLQQNEYNQHDYEISQTEFNNILLTHEDLNNKLVLYVSTKIHPVVWYFDFISNTFLFFELGLRGVIAQSKVRFTLNPLNICDLVSTAAVFIVLYCDNKPVLFMRKDFTKWAMLLGIAYSARVLRILRIASYSEEMKILILSLKTSCRDLLFLIICFTSFSVFFGSLMYSAELHSNDSFDNVLISVWWAVITMATIGYGDEYPHTTPGYILGTITAVTGIILLAMPVAVLSSNFSQLYKCNKIKNKAILYQIRMAEHEKRVLSLKNSKQNTEKILVQEL